MTISQTKERLRVLHVISGDLWAGAEAQAATLLKFLKKDCDLCAVLLNDGELASRLRQLDIEVHILNEQTLSTWQIFLKLRALMKQFKPDAVHTHRQKENILGAFANETTVKARCVRTVHGAPEFSGNWKSNLQRNLDHWVGRHLQDKIIAVSDELKEKLTAYFPSDKIAVVYNGVDVDELKRQAGITEFKQNEPNKKHIGIIGRLVPVKRVDIFLETAALFKKDNIEDYHFHVVGDGPLDTELKTLAQTLNVEDIVTFHGHRSDIPSVIHSLDAVVMCSDHEGMPMVALETAALGTHFLPTDNLAMSKQIDNAPMDFTPHQSPTAISRSLRTLDGFKASTFQFNTAGKCSQQTAEQYS